MPFFGAGENTSTVYKEDRRNKVFPDAYCSLGEDQTAFLAGARALMQGWHKTQVLS